MGLGSNRGMGNFPFLAVLLMPDATKRTQYGAIDGDRTPTTGLKLDQVDEMATQTANLGWQDGEDGEHLPLPRATGWKAP